MAPYGMPQAHRIVTMTNFRYHGRVRTALRALTNIPTYRSLTISEREIYEGCAGEGGHAYD
jgi:hypothetical protein